MTEDKKVKKGNFKTILFVLLLVFTILYMVTRAFPTNLGISPKTIVPQKTVNLETVKTKGIIIMDEDVFRANNKGKFETNIVEGRRVSAGTHIGVLTSIESNQYIENEIAQLDNSINEIKNLREASGQGDSSLTKDEIIFNLTIAIQEKIKLKDYNTVYILKEQLNTITSQAEEEEIVQEEASEPSPENQEEQVVEATEVQEDSGLDTLESLQNRRDDLSQQLSESVHNYYSERASIISYKMDGLEEDYTPNDFEKYTYDKVNKDIKQGLPIAEKVEVLNIDEPIYKSIDNFVWYLAIKVDNISAVKDLDDKKTLMIRLNNTSNNLTGKIVAVNKFKNSGVIVLEFRSKLHDYYTTRFPEVQIINSYSSGFKFPKEAIIKQDDYVGVLVKDLSGIVRFRPIHIDGEDETHYFIRPGDDNGYVRLPKKDNESVKTVTEFDEVFLNPSSIREGRIIE